MISAGLFLFLLIGIIAAVEVERGDSLVRLTVAERPLVMRRRDEKKRLKRLGLAGKVRS